VKLLLLALTLLTWFTALTSRPVWASSPSNPQFNVDEVIALIQKKDLRSVDELLPLLPKNCQQVINIFFQSASLQAASEKAPRVLLSCLKNDAFSYNGFTLAFNTSPDLFGFDRLEMVQFREKTASFEYREVAFTPEARAKVSGANPAVCQSCHYPDARPNWDPYFVWPGAFGMMDEEDPQGLSLMEKEGMASFSFLSRVQELDARPTNQEIASQPNNLRLNEFFSPLNTQRIVRKILNEPKLKPYRYAIVGVAGCSYARAEAKYNDHLDGAYDEAVLEGVAFPPEDFLTARSRAARADSAYYLKDTVEKQQSNFAERVAITGRLGCSRSDRTHDLLESGIFKAPEFLSNRVSELRYVIEGAGVSMEDWSMATFRHSYSFNNGGAWSELYPALRKALLDPKRDADLLATGVEPTPEFCEAIRKKSLAAEAEAGL
jgi:hypothetical protein